MADIPHAVAIFDILTKSKRSGTIDEWEVSGPFVRFRQGQCNFYVHIRSALSVLETELIDKTTVTRIPIAVEPELLTAG